MKAAVLNWTAESGHFGSKLVCETISQLLYLNDIEVISRVPSAENWEDWRHDLDKVDLVLVNGEGSLHHDRHLSLLEVAGHYPSVLFNTVFDQITKPGALERFLAITTRESHSMAQVEENLDRIWPDLTVIPDVILQSVTLAYHRKQLPGLGSGTCVTDSVTFNTGLSPFMDARKYLDILCKHEAVCTGRFHGIMACASLGLPFSAYGTNCHKNKAVMDDMGLLGFYDDNFYTAKELTPRTPHQRALEYCKEGRNKILQFFSGLHGYK